MDAVDAFFKIGCQYYVAGRFAAFARFHPVVGNLFHHAIEMYLKGALSEKRSLNELRKLSHNLPSIWKAFKIEANDSALDRFDATIAGLHDYEELRYPDSVIVRGMDTTINIIRSSLSTGAAKGGTSIPQYQVCVQDIDELVDVILAPQAVTQRHTSDSMTPRTSF
jgi:hypothetical protein